MSLIDVKIDERIATITLNRPKVNALNEPLIDELREAFDDAENNGDINSVILTGGGVVSFPLVLMFRGLCLIQKIHLSVMCLGTQNL